MGGLAKKYEKGNNTPEFLKHYAETMMLARVGGHEKFAAEYLLSQENWLTKETASFVLDMAPTDMDNNLYQFLSKNRVALEELVYVEQLTATLERGVMAKIRSTKAKSDTDIRSIFAEVFPGQEDMKLAKYNMRKNSRAKSEEGRAAYYKAAIAYLDNYEIKDANLLNGAAWTFYEWTDDKDLLTHARAWAIKSVKLNSGFANNDTLAAVCFKLKEKQLAEKHALLAIELAKKEGADYAETSALLDKIKAL